MTEKNTTQASAAADKIAQPDILVQGGGTVYLFRPLNAAAVEHLEENTSEEAQWFGGALVVEHRYAGDLAEALQEEGFSVQ
jgi:hypothetical protein